MELADGKRDVVDPEARAYVSSLVTAVSITSVALESCANESSLEEAAPMKTDDTYSETTLLHVCAI